MQVVMVASALENERTVAELVIASVLEYCSPDNDAPTTPPLRESLIATLAAALVAPEDGGQARHADHLGALLARTLGSDGEALGLLQLALAEHRPLRRPGDSERDDRARHARFLGAVAGGFHRAAAREAPPATRPLDGADDPRLRLLITQIPSVVWTTDRDLRITSARASSVLGLDDDLPNLIGRELTGRQLPREMRDHPSVVSAHREALTGAVAAFEIVILGVPYRALVAPLHAADGTIVGCVGSAIDDRKRQDSRREIAQSQARYQSLVESIDGVVWEHDLDARRYTFVSRQAETMLGYPQEAWLDTVGFWDETIHPDDRDRIFAELGAPHELQPTYHLEYRVRAADGHWIWVRNFFTVIIEPGQPTRTRGVFFDVTLDHAIAQELRQSQEQFRAIFDNAELGIALVDAAGVVSLANAAMHQMLGFTPGTLQGTQLGAISHPEDRALTNGPFIEMINHRGPSFQIEKRYVHRDGRVVWVHLAVSAVADLHDRDQAAIVIMKDITSRKHFEEEFRYQLSLTQAITSSFRGGLCALDRDGRVTFINPAAEQMLGWADSSLLAAPLFERVHGPDENVTAATWQTATQRGQIVEVDDAIFVRRNGTTFHVGYTLSPLIEDGVVRGAILGFRDITERQRLQGELTAVNRLLAESREQAQQHLARELHDGALQLLIGISYQLGRRLADQHDDELRSVRLAVLEVVAQLRSLLGELRPAGLEELGLSTALEGYVARLQREAGPSAPEIALDLDAAGPDVPLPVARCLFRIAQEGLRNAVRHAQAGRIDLRLRLSESEAILHLSDDGNGFAVPSSLAALTQSNHFGLVGMAERVALASGQLNLKSQIGEGTTIQLHLPLRPSDQVAGRGHVEMTSTLLLHSSLQRR